MIRLFSIQNFTNSDVILISAYQWPIGKPLPSNADEPMAVEYQLHGERNSDICRFQRHRETLEDPKLAFWAIYFITFPK